METIALDSWKQLSDWADQYTQQNRFVFRGQGAAAWRLRTSLARYFIENRVDDHEWRKRELKMYRLFRERLLNLCPGMYDNWNPIDILSLMQHHGTPTRLLDFTYSPLVAAYFALHDARGDSAIWVIDTEHLKDMQKAQGFEAYAGPTHIEDYKIAEKHSGATVLFPSYPHVRLAAQRGCFLVPGQISANISRALINSQVILAEELVLHSLTRLRGFGIDEEFLFPDLDRIAQETNRFSVTGSAEIPRNNAKAS